MRKPLRVFSFAGLGLLALALATTLISVVNPQIAQDRRAIDQARQLIQLDTRLSLQLLQVRNSLAANYDPVVDTVHALDQDGAELLVETRAARGADSAATGSARAATASVLRQKLQLVEDFKSSFAVLRNSIATLSVLAADVERHRTSSEIDAEATRRAMALMLALSRLFMAGGSEQERAVDGARAALAASAIVAGPLRATVDQILALTQVARQYRAETDNRMSHMLALPVSGHLDRLADSYAEHLAHADGRRRELVAGLGLTGLLAALMAIQGLRSQHRVRVSLEQRVEERTRDLAEANATLTRASRAKTEFLANMSHEIRTPLAAILGFADLLEGERLKRTERCEIARVIRRNGEHLLAILSDILDIAKIEAGKLTVEQIACSPRLLSEEVCALLRNRAEAKGISLSFVVESNDVPRHLESDPTRIRQVLVNLVGNAIKFTERGSVTLALRMERHANNPQLLFEVRDTGIGMAPDEITRVFAAFEQADSSTTRRFGGTGLGLAISRRLATVLGGEINVRSERNKGSIFSLSLPATEHLAGAAADLLETAVIAPRGLLPRRGLRVLVADDSADIRLLVTSFLADIDAEVAVVCNGREAVEVAMTATHEGRAFDLILMDLHMPEMDGAQAVQALRAAGVNQPVIALTASAYLEDRDRCARAGYSDFITKPIDRLQFVQKIATLAGVGDVDDAPAHDSQALPATPPSEHGNSVFDGDRLLAMVGGDHSVRDAVVGLFQGDAPSLLETIQVAVTARDATAVRASAHKMKGMLLTVCALQAAETATELETVARAGQEHRFETLVGTLAVQVSRVRESMMRAAPPAS